MSMEPQREDASTYFVQDRGNLEEMHRLEVQDRLLTTGMGGVLEELADPTLLRRVLDVGCATGGWLMQTASIYPMIEKLVGVDISSKMMAYARSKAEDQHLADRVEFRTMDALRTLDFPDAYFDLVNQRYGIGWLRTWEWEKVLLEYQRVTRPGGIIRITETNVTAESNSPALTKLCTIGLEPLYRSGRLPAPRNDALTGELVHLMTQSGIQDVQTRVHTLVFQAGTESGQYFYEDMLHYFRVGLPFFQQWTRLPDDYEETYQQALLDMQATDFVATSKLLTVCGIRP